MTDVADDKATHVDEQIPAKPQAPKKPAEKTKAAPVDHGVGLLHR